MAWIDAATNNDYDDNNRFMSCLGVVVKHANSQNRVVSWIPPYVTFKAPLVKKTTGNHLMNSTSLEKTHSPVSGFCYARNRVCNAYNYLCRDAFSGKEVLLSIRTLLYTILGKPNLKTELLNNHNLKMLLEFFSTLLAMPLAIENVLSGWT